MASLIDELNKLKSLHVSVTLFGTLSTIAPGFLILYHYKPELVQSLDVLKILLFSFSLSLPILALNAAFVIGANPSESIPLSKQFILAMVFTFILMYSTLLISWSFKLSFATLIIIIAVIEIIGFVISLSHKHRISKESSNKQNQADA